MTSTVHGFDDQVFKDRVMRAQRRMCDLDLSALLLTTEPEIRYYTGFLTRFWESPTRPWFVVLPAKQAPIAVIPSIGAHLMRQTWVDDIRTWQAPDYGDDGIGLLADTLKACTDQDATIGLADGMESHLRMPLADFRQLENIVGRRTFTSDHNITRDLRIVKSEEEIAKIRTAADIANRAFDRVPDTIGQGIAIDDAFRKFQILCLEEGADWVPYLAGAADTGGYDDVISPATTQPIRDGDILMLDTGLVWDGYFCDFDRNYSIGRPSADVQSAHARLIEATQAGFETAKPGAVIADLFHAMNNVVNPGGTGSEAGRLGHGLGMQLTEWPSIIPEDVTPLVPGMVLTLEPNITLPNGKMMVHEENIVITETGADYISAPQAAEIRVI